MDFRTKLIVLSGTVFLSATVSKNTVFCMLISFLLLYIAFQKEWKTVVRCSLLLSLVFVLRLYSKGNGLGILIPEMFLFIITRMTAVFMSALPIVKTQPGELRAIFKKLNVHRNFHLPLIFMLRFFPTVKYEFREIIESLRLRGICSWKKPLTAVEYLFVPMIFSASKTAEELAAAAEVRGISAEGDHSSRRLIQFKKSDWLISVVTALFCAILYYWEQLPV
ncbi:energy-coupling factor transporter transmembrane component T family protein [Treponema denticola]|uniref:energy-coupling factor transporter transmembrane component T family protein n=1 Tax=Treponema denticola TaxID=158 RepID=UPI00124A656A|nr:energy-coupling factor transporter transmembrane component T [Treponema denticola]